MSELTEQIRVTCESIAENQKKVYDLGFKEGKASVKLITFYAYTDWEEPYLALSGMTWREYVESELNNGVFSIVNDKIRYWDTSFVDANADDVIVEYGIYRILSTFYFLYNNNNYTLPCYPYQDWESWVDSDFNTIGLYFDEDNKLRTPTGELVIADAGEEIFIVDKWSSIEWGGYKAFKVGTCDAYFETLNFEIGMTWYDYIDSSYSTGGVYLDETDNIHHYGGDADKTYYYNGVQVSPNDLMIDGATYEYR